MNRIAAPNYTQVPNLFLDDMARDMQEAELRVALVIMRETFGWHRQSKQMSLSYIQQATGLSRQGVINGVKSGVERGVFFREQVGDSWEYGLVVNEVDQGSQPSRPVLVNEVDTTKKEKERDKEINGLTSAISTALQQHMPFGVTALMVEQHVEIAAKYGLEAWRAGFDATPQRAKHNATYVLKATLSNLPEKEPEKEIVPATITIFADDGKVLEVVET